MAVARLLQPTHTSSSYTQSFVAVRAQCRDDGCAVSWMAAWGMDSHLTHAVQPPHNQKVIHGLHIAIDQQLDHVVHTQWCLRTLWSFVTDASRRCYSLLDDAARIAAAHCTHPRWMANSSGVMPSLSALSTSAPALISAAATSAMPHAQQQEVVCSHPCPPCQHPPLP